MKKKINSLFLVLIAALTITGCKKEFRLDEPGNLVPKTVLEDPSLPSIGINGTRLHAEEFGNPDSPIVIILHGGPGADYQSLLNCRDLSDDGYYVIFYDQRGSGLSQRHEKSSYTMQVMLDDLDAVISHYKRTTAQKVFLFGHSWGAMLATSYVNTHPAKVNGIILAEPGGFTWKDTKDYINRVRDLSPFSESANDIFYLNQFLTGRQNEHQVLDYKMAVSMAYDYKDGNSLGNTGRYPFLRMGAVVNQALLEIGENDGFDWTTHLSLFNTKVLFCYSELNRAYGKDHAQLVSSPYPDVQLEKINGCGHEMVYFGWNQLYPLTKTYLNSLR